MANWKMAKIGDFMFERQGRYKPNTSKISGLCRIDKIDFSGNFHIANKPSKTDMILIKRGDLVISGINVAKGALGVYDGDEAVTATIHYSSYTFDEDKISVEYFKRFLKSPLFIQLLKEQVKGGIKTEIKPKHLLPLEIPLPSKVEQLSILNRFQRIEKEDIELKFELNHQKTLLKKLRQQILQEAIEGKLTADWRVQNPDVEPARSGESGGTRRGVLGPGSTRAREEDRRRCATRVLRIGRHRERRETGHLHRPARPRRRLDRRAEGA